MREIIGNTTATPTPRPDWKQTDETKADFIKNKPEILTEEKVIDLIGVHGSGAQVQADWTQTDENKKDYIKNKPDVLTEEEIIGLIDEYGGDNQLQADWTQTDDAQLDYIKNKPSILTEENVINLIGTHGAEAQVQSNWTETDENSKSFIQNKPTVLTQDEIIGLIDQWGGDEQVQANWTQQDNTAPDYIQNKPNLVWIDRVEQTSTIGNIRTYTFYFTNGETFSFNVTDGRDGRDGIDGVDGKDGVEGITHSWEGSVLTVTSASGTTSMDLRGPQGIKGDIGGADGLITMQDAQGRNLLYLTCGDTVLGEGIVIPQGGGGGGSTNNAVLTATNTTGWLSKTISEGAECTLSFQWSSLENGMSTGNGIVTVSVGGAVKTSYEITQGEHPIDVGKYLTAGTNKVVIEITDGYGNTRELKYSITTVSISISSYFDGTIARTGAITYSYIPTGEAEKKVYFLVDGNLIGTKEVTVSGREQTYTIPAQTHGSHTLEVYFTAKIDGQDTPSNRLFYDLICYEEGETTPIIAVPKRVTTAKQYETVAIPYIVYTPNALTSDIELSDGDEVKSLTVDRTQQIWSYKPVNPGTANLSIACGDVSKPLSFPVTESNIKVNAETENLELYLTSAKRSNNEKDPQEWSSGIVKAELTGFNFISDGWKLDADNNTVLRVSGDARVYIPFNIFGSDFRSTGKTIEFEFATRDVLNYDAVILSSWSGDRGIEITAQKAMLKSEQSEIFTQYKENEIVRISFTIEKSAENRLLAIYINGIMSGVVQYPSDDDFSQPSPVGITIGSNDCTTDIYCIRVYSNNLTRYQILDNWIADTQNIEEFVERYKRNDIFDAYGKIVPSKIPSYLPYMVLNVGKYEDLPQSKGDKKPISGSYIDPLYPQRNFTFTGAEIDVQGTSSQYYSRKNYKIKFKGGFNINGQVVSGYQLRNSSIPTDEFTYKADVASSEGANNVELVMLYDDVCPVKTPPQVEDSRVRQGIEGYPMLMFYGEGSELTFLGKYNFNNDKGTEEVFGFKAGDESWEILQNNTEMVIWKDDNFSGDAWKTSFEGRYPDKNIDITRLSAFSSWLKSTDTTVVSTEEEKAERLQKFKDEFENWCNKDAMLFNYIFTEMFLMVDNRAKNAFPTRYDADGKWLILPYDYDTAIGINNEGELKFGYALEDTDLVNGNNVFNGQDSVLYVNMRLAFADEIMDMYKDLRSGDVFSYEEIEKRFEEHQNVWGEAIFNEDARFKYIDPLVNEGNKTYLPMLQGSKAEQRKWWLYNRFRYLDSKYNAGDALEDYIMLRSYAVDDITVTPYADIYATVKYDSELVQKRALRGKDEDGNDQTYTLENPLSGGRDAVVSIYSASQLLSVGDLSGLKAGMADFSSAVKLSSLKVGSAEEGYDNPNLTELTIGNLVLLRTLDVRNCSALKQTVDVSGCTNIENIYLDGTQTTGVTLPNGGSLKVLHLPSTVTNLTILNQKNLTEFVLPSYSNVSTLRIENTPVIDTMAALNSIKADSRVRLVGVDWTINTSGEVLTLMDKLDTFRGLDENGGNLDNAVISGVIHVDSLTFDELTEMNRRYPNITIDYRVIKVKVRFYNEETLLSEALYAEGETIVVPDNPTKESTIQHTYSFKGWSIDGINVVEIGVAGSETVNYYALFNEELRYYTVRFLNGTTVLQTGLVAYGETPIYVGEDPIPKEDYMFVGWRPDISVVTGDIDYVAKFRSTKSQARMLVDKSITEYSSDIPLCAGDYAFYNCTALTSVDLPSATSIGSYAFSNCKALTSIDLPLATTIDDMAFYNCTALTSVDLPSATSIGNFAFHICTALTSIDLPSATTIGSNTFDNCKTLTSVDLPSATSIGNYAFQSCNELTNISVPNVTSIGFKVFYDLKRLTSIDLPSVTSIGDDAFNQCQGLGSVNVPMLEAVNTRTFRYCAITSIDLPCATTIKSQAFQACYNLTTVILRSTTLCSLANINAFNNTPFDSNDAGGTVYVPQALIESYQNATNWSTLYTTGKCNFVAIEGSEYE